MSGQKNSGEHFADAYDLKNSDETKAFYAKWANSYDQEIGNDKGYRQPKRCVDALLKHNIGKDVSIIDIGCGTGLSGVALHYAGYTNIDGCDLSDEMLDKARGKSVYKHLFETNLNRPPIDARDESYDVATCVGVFSFGHVEPAAIDEILRILKPCGILVIGLNDHFYDEGSFPAKLEALVTARKLQILSREHGLHLENVEGSTGWVITSRKI